MTDTASTPRKRTPLDQEIEDTKSEIKQLLRKRNITFGVIGVAVVADTILWIVYAITRNDTVAGFAVGVIVVSFSAFMATLIVYEDDLYSRSDLLGAQGHLKRLEIQRREILVKSTGAAGSAHARYRETIPDLIEHYRISANRNRSINHSLQTFIIVGSLAASSVIGLLGQSLLARWVAVALTLALGVSSSLNSYYRFRERSDQLHATANLIEIEFRGLILGIGDYADKPSRDALQYFVEVVEKIRSEHVTRERELDHPADIGYIDQSSINS